MSSHRHHCRKSSRFKEMSPTFLSSSRKAFIEHTYSLFLCYHHSVPSPWYSARQHSKRQWGWKRESEPILRPQTRDAAVAEQTNGRVRETRKNKALKTKDMDRLWFAPPFHPFTPYSYISLAAYLQLARRRCCWKTRNISLSFVACGISRSLFPRLRGVSHVLSLNSFCEIRIAGFVRTALWGDLRRFLSQLVFVPRFCADNARAFLREWDAIRNNCTFPYQPRDSRGCPRLRKIPLVPARGRDEICLPHV